MQGNVANEKDMQVSVTINIPGQPPLELKLPLRGTPRALEELFQALSQYTQTSDIKVAGGSCCWTFSQTQGNVHLLLDQNATK